MDLPEIRTYVRLYMDLEAEDMDDRLIDRWVNEGLVRVIRATSRWPFYEYSETIQLTPTTYEFIFTNFSMVTSVEVSGSVGPIDFIDVSDAETNYFFSGEALVGRPQRYSKWNGGLKVWPVPDAEYTLTVRGYRKPIHGDELDLPEDYHEAVLEWVMHKAFMHQDELETAAAHRATFDDLLITLMREEKTADADFPLVFNGGSHRSYRARNGLGRTWEPGLGGWAT